ncbi:hypothetical protein DFP72DRAFT_1045621 [Ephemerocybe angulata]|uniref:Uncharacterized protein n=1 Tax=Ephemerocybe angulata TaxID=980116 RepID=A0A8H6M6T8_9AGAR|nr:hypothetical protein DFP72DRAFT_1045621 [Tulosesus angulatus]
MSPEVKSHTAGTERLGERQNVAAVDLSRAKVAGESSRRWRRAPGTLERRGNGAGCQYRRRGYIGKLTHSYRRESPADGDLGNARDQRPKIHPKKWIIRTRAAEKMSSLNGLMGLGIWAGWRMKSWTGSAGTRWAAVQNDEKCLKKSKHYFNATHRGLFERPGSLSEGKSIRPVNRLANWTTHRMATFYISDSGKRHEMPRLGRGRTGFGAWVNDLGDADTTYRNPENGSGASGFRMELGDVRVGYHSAGARVRTKRPVTQTQHIGFRKNMLKRGSDMVVGLATSESYISKSGEQGEMTWDGECRCPGTVESTDISGRRGPPALNHGTTTRIGNSIFGGPGNGVVKEEEFLELGYIEKDDVALSGGIQSGLGKVECGVRRARLGDTDEVIREQRRMTVPSGMLESAQLRKNVIEGADQNNLIVHGKGLRDTELAYWPQATLKPELA